MLLKSYKNILPASIAVIWGIVFAIGQPEIILADNQVRYTPTSRPKPKRTQGGGSRLHSQFLFVPSQILLLQKPIL